MQRYVEQLLTDIHNAAQNLPWPFIKRESVSLHDWQSLEEEDATAPMRKLSEWTGITPEMLPSSAMLKNDEVHALLEALNALLSTCNCEVVFQTMVPEHIQYEAIRQNFNQHVIVRQWHMGFFAFCKPGTESKTCVLGDHCQCAFYDELFAGQVDEDLSAEEERARVLEIEVRHIQRKYGDEWKKYYPYHLDKNYDDENGNPYDYGMGDDEWWRE